MKDKRKSDYYKSRCKKDVNALRNQLKLKNSLQTNKGEVEI